MITKARNGRERGAGGAGDEVVRRRWGSFAARVRGCSSELRIPSNRCAVVLRRWNVVSEGRNTPAAWNWGGGPFTSSGALEQFWPERGPGRERLGLGAVLGSGEAAAAVCGGWDVVVRRVYSGAALCSALNLEGSGG